MTERNQTDQIKVQKPALKLAYLHMKFAAMKHKEFLG